ncbi:4-aminobutyrate aminotransferase [Penicillium manginii]|uniref:4-aminobutyrate aminotransferase n=1 Tax=Penicillium manginii TaxID=203109 RepID=UPI0025492F60|nr:4-aminobutyrate aminotransferase [Penicillium manginii]KAJ5743004.1 4-aminobutyrate aminotransferase [Penicillium manginii]
MASILRCSPKLRTVARVPAARALSTTARLQAAEKPFFPNEPTAPSLKTAIPGPKNKAAAAELDEVFDVRSLNMLTDYQQSIASPISMATSCLMSMPRLPLSPLVTTTPHLKQVAQSDEMITSLINRPALGNFPSADWSQILRTGILKAAPKGLNQVFTAMAGSDANETAYKAAFMYYRQLQRGGPDVEFTEEELLSTMNNQGPGSPQLSILSFKSAFHGRLFGSLSTTRSKAIHKLDIPAFDWPQATFPTLKYPLEEHVQENAAEEKRCLEEVERLIKEYHNPVAAVMVEPIQSEGGDNHASPAFFQGLRDITKRTNVLFIVDEVQTGVGATGKFWAHDHWNLSSPPDMVTFSKKAQTAGYYFGNPALRPNKPYRQFNTWMGDPSRALIFRGIIEEVERLGLVENTRVTGDYLYAGLDRLAQKYPAHFQNLRGKGQGTFIAWDTPKRDEFLAKAKSVGVNIGGSGAQAIRLRPMLVFQQHHADILLESIEKIIKLL